MPHHYTLPIKFLLNEVFLRPEQEIVAQDQYIADLFYFSLASQGSTVEDSLFHVESPYFIDDEADFTYEKAMRLKRSPRICD